MPSAPPHEGSPGSLLGSTLVKCAGSGFVAGAPGSGTAWHSPSNTTPSPVGEGLGRAVACLGPANATEMLAGGDGGIRKAVLGSWTSPLGVGDVLSMSTSDDPQLPLLIGYNYGLVFANASNGTQIGSTISGDAGYGAVVHWFPGQPRFAVTHVVGAMVRIYDYEPSGPTITQVDTITNGTPGFGRAIAVADVLPSPGDELIIGAAGAVFIYLSNGDGPMMRLSGTDTSFGASITTAPDNSGLHQMFIGQPATDYVYRFLGDAGAVISQGPTSGERFGASVAANGYELAIGAPFHASGSGAVYTSTLLPGIPFGEVQECQVGRACLNQQCSAGVCVGGVFCDQSMPVPGCALTWACDQGRCVPNDAGVIDPDDAGVIDLDSGVIDDDGGLMVPDASFMIDAGRPDASVLFDAGGSFDAGAGDGGPGDAGVEPMRDGGMDAGHTERDAGVDDRDGGVKPLQDAGSDELDGGLDPMYFTTSGCSESGLLPMLALCLAILGRRASRSLRERG